MIMAAATGSGVAGGSIGTDANFCMDSRCIGATNPGGVFEASSAWYCYNNNTSAIINAGTVSAKSQTGFTLNCTNHAGTSPTGDVTVGWSAEN